jgi:hypothetical protein
MQQLALRVLPCHCSQRLLGSRDLSYLNLLPYQHAWLCLVIESAYLDLTLGQEQLRLPFHGFPYVRVSACLHSQRVLACVWSWGHSKAAPCTCAWKLLPCHPYLDAPAAVLTNKPPQDWCPGRCKCMPACLSVCPSLCLGLGALSALPARHACTHAAQPSAHGGHGDLDLHSTAQHSMPDSDAHYTIAAVVAGRLAVQ